jgi:hypothetical protein
MINRTRETLPKGGTKRAATGHGFAGISVMTPRAVVYHPPVAVPITANNGLVKQKWFTGV